ncbi:MAG: vWA domain-containing protein [Clostridia bacterium]|jgi:uncharacterized protein YegL|nr:VWA domain-containing protein [Clostridia bacterium]NLV34721.1 VWA domain-containing protein [Clostridiaceae bacterium]MDD4501822.1 VWA domain-containing protein [Clostridia bacterium]HPB16723.1 VWA domain-containing protein [Clostridia bacterium]HQM96637.1 VWA domain-containing protein [Clostridia bacterium]
MRKDLTELVFILDRSGSMSGMESDTIGGFNSLLEKQKKVDGEAIVTTVLFDDRYELLHDRIGIKGINKIGENEYFVRGSTALLDAIGRTITKIENALNHTSEDERAEKVFVVIITDGYENASREFTYPMIKELIESKKGKNWEFIFLGANIDVAEESMRIGIARDRAVKFKVDPKGVRANYSVMSDVICKFRDIGSIDNDLQEKIEESRKNSKSKK